MFLKVIRKPAKVVSVYECDRYTLQPNEQSNTEDVTLENDTTGNSITLTLGRNEGISLYAMNADGKTIDTYYI